jgi:hypothetical protein
MNQQQLSDAFEELKQEATELAGGLNDLTQRATVYHHMFLDSKGNHAFPLIAAHGALWAKGYFRFGRRIANVLSLQFAFSPSIRRERLAQMQKFTDSIRDINRRVCIDSYTNYHFTKRYGHIEAAAEFVPSDLFAALMAVHAAAESGSELPEEQKQEIFESHFLHEQQHVVGPTIIESLEELNWPLLQAIAMRPIVKFSYFSKPRSFWFKNFANRDERIQRGFEAFSIGSQAGWKTVEAKLADYKVLPTQFFESPRTYFQAMRSAVLS